MVLPGKTVADLEAAIDVEIARMKAEPIAGWELDKARNNAKRTFVSGLGSSLTRAILLSQYALFYDDPNRINTRVDRIAAVTAADVQRVARQYLVPASRTVVITTPKAAGTGGGE
jgi:predicted Zn-dependent peptidase